MSDSRIYLCFGMDSLQMKSEQWNTIVIKLASFPNPISDRFHIITIQQLLQPSDFLVCSIENYWEVISAWLTKNNFSTIL